MVRLPSLPRSALAAAAPALRGAAQGHRQQFTRPPRQPGGCRSLSRAAAPSASPGCSALPPCRRIHDARLPSQLAPPIRAGPAAAAAATLSRTLPALPQSDVRALVLTPQDRRVVVGRLARAVLSFQDTFLSRDSSPSGLLCQVRRRQRLCGQASCLPRAGLMAGRRSAAAAGWLYVG